MFRLLKILHPVWYFNLKPATDHGYFPDMDARHKFLSEVDVAPDPAFGAAASRAERAYRAHRLGVVPATGASGTGWWEVQRFPLTDEYRFARKYFHPARVWWLLLYRLLTFNNPFAETFAFVKTLGTPRFRFDGATRIPQHYREFRSALEAAAPKITVVIPTLNRYPYLRDVLADLEKQEYKNFDVIVIDQSEPYQPEIYNGYQLNMQVIRQEEKALWLARNTAIQKSDSEFLLFYDDDSRVAPDWIAQHLRCIDFFGCDISSGVSVSKVGGKVPLNYRFFRWSDQLDTGNVMIRRQVFRIAGLFDRQFERMRMGDGEFGLRAYLAGFKNISNPLASRLHLKVGEGGLRVMGHWDAFRPKSFWSPRPVPSVFYLYRKYHGNRQARLSLYQNLLPSLVPYRFKGNRMLLALGSVAALFLLPLVLPQVMRSWSLSGRMLRTGGPEPLNGP